MQYQRLAIWIWSKYILVPSDKEFLDITPQASGPKVPSETSAARYHPESLLFIASPRRTAATQAPVLSRSDL